MEEPRTSLWSRLVMFYSVCKADQLKPEVMAEIVVKYGSKEKELSARLLKKYGRPLPQSVPAEELRQVLARFGMEDQGSEGRASRESSDARQAAGARTGGGGGGGDGRSTAYAAGGSSAAAAGPGSDSWEARRAPLRGPRATAPLPAGALDFRSKFFNPLEALRHRTLRPPFPREPALDNLFKFRGLMPKRPPPPPPAPSPTAAAAPASVESAPKPGATVARPGENVIPGANVTASTLSAPGQAAGIVAATRGGAALPTAGSGSGSGSGIGIGIGSGSGIGSGTAAGGSEAGGAKSSGPAPVDGDDNSPRDVARAGKASGDSSREGEGAGKASSGDENITKQSRAFGTPGGVYPGMLRQGDGGSMAGHYGSMSSAVEMKVAEKVKAVWRRGAELASKPAATHSKGRSAESRGTPVQRIMREYAGTGPYSLLYRLHEEKRRASVMIRRVNSVRGTCTGLIRAFDRHMNLLLVDVREDYTVLVPAREPKPLSENVPRTGAEKMRDKKALGTLATDVGAAATSSSGLVEEGGFGAAASSGTLVEAGAAGDGIGNRARADVRAISLGSGGARGGGSCMDLSSDSGGAESEIEEGEIVDEGGKTSGEIESGHENKSVRMTSGGVEGEGGSHEKVVRKTEVPVEGRGGQFKEPDPGGKNMPFVGEGNASGSVDFAGKSGEVCSEIVATGNKSTTAPDSGTSSKKEPEGSATEGSGSKVDGTGTATAEQIADDDVNSSGNPDTSVQLGAPQEGEGVHEKGEAEGFGQEKRPGGRRSRARGPWRGEFKSVRRERFLKQLLIRGDNVVMVWEAPRS